ncbi:MAG: YybH family protein [Gemmatimonadota bacterium]
MLRMSRFFVLAGGLMACQPAQETPSGSAERTADRHEAVLEVVERKNDRIETLYAEGEVDSLVAMFAEDVWQMPPNMAPLVGREALRGFWSDAMQWGDWTFELRTEDLVVSDSIAVERGTYAMSVEADPEAPIPSMRDQGNYVVLWRLDPDGEWRIVWDAPVSELPPGGTGEGAAGGE